MTHSKKGEHYVIDTNVFMVADGSEDKGSRKAAPFCRKAKMQFLEKLLYCGIMRLDLNGEIKSEYEGWLPQFGELGVGTLVYKEMLQHGFVKYIALRRENGQYVNLPDAIRSGFDKDDQKFASLAMKENAPVATAADSDWFEPLLKVHGLRVLLLCGEDRESWFI